MDGASVLTDFRPPVCSTLPQRCSEATDDWLHVTVTSESEATMTDMGAKLPTSSCTERQVPEQR